MRHTIWVEAETQVPEGLVQHMQELICSALALEGVELSCELSLLLTDNAGIHQINLEQRGVDSPTDVLSFPMFELTAGQHPTAADADPETGLVPLGDIAISLERAQEQAGQFGHSLNRELSYLIVHSVLHLLGYDHMDEGAMKAQMRAREEYILDALHIPRE